MMTLEQKIAYSKAFILILHREFGNEGPGALFYEVS